MLTLAEVQQNVIYKLRNVIVFFFLLHNIYTYRHHKVFSMEKRLLEKNRICISYLFIWGKGCARLSFRAKKKGCIRLHLEMKRKLQRQRIKKQKETILEVRLHHHDKNMMPKATETWKNMLFEIDQRFVYICSIS